MIEFLHYPRFGRMWTGYSLLSQGWAIAALLVVVSGCKGKSDWTRPAGAPGASSEWPLSWGAEPDGLIYAHLEAWRASGVELRSCSESFIGRFGHAELGKVKWPRVLCERNLDATVVRGGPDGTSIAFSSDGALYVGPLTGSRFKRITPDSLDAVGALAWSSDGLRIAFVGRDSRKAGVTRQGIYSVRTNGSGPLKIRDLAVNERVSAISWSSDGGALAVATSVIDSFGRAIRTIVVVDTNGTAQHVLAAGVEPSWSPTGEWIAYLRDDSLKGTDSARMYVAQPGRMALSIIRPNSADARAVLIDSTPSGTIVGPIVWREDGSELAFGIRTDSGTVIWTATPKVGD